MDIKKINGFIHQNINKFIEEIIGEKNSNGRLNCPFCGGANTLAYNEKNFRWGCFHSNCENMIGDSIQLTILVKNNLSLSDFKKLEKDKRAKFFTETVNFLRKWILSKNVDLENIQSLENISFTKKNKKTISLRNDKILTLLLNLEKANFEGSLEKIQFLDYLDKLGANANKLYINLFDKRKAYNHLEFYYLLKEELEKEDFEVLDNFKILFETTFFPDGKENTNTVFNRSFKPCSTWKRFNFSTLKKFRIFDTTDEAPKMLQYFRFYPVFDETNILVGAQGRIKEYEELNASQKRFYNKMEKDGKSISKCYNFKGFQKGKVIYNLQNVDISVANYIIIHEGPADVIKAHTFGENNVISFLGKTISDEQFEILKNKLNEKTIIYVFLDNDEAGREGTLQICQKIKHYFNNVFTVKIKNTAIKDAGEITNQNDYFDAIALAKKWQ